MSSLFSDVRFALRLLLRNPGFSLITVLILALGIGLNGVIFSLLHAVVLAPLPFDEPDRLVFILERSNKFRGMSVSYPNFLDYRDRQKVFTHIAAHRDQTYNLTGGDGPPQQLSGIHVSASLFPLLRTEAYLGRVFSEQEDKPGAPRLALLGHGFWTRMGGDPQVVGTAILLDAEPYQVVGVMPEGFVYPLSQQRVDVYTSIGRWVGENIDSRMERGNHPGITLTARLKPAITVEQARQSMDSISAALEAEFPDSNTGVATSITLLQERLTRDLCPALLVLTISVFLLLLLTCVNVANLHLAQSTLRSAEVAIRSALGAGRKRVFRQLLTESVLQGLLGGAVGLGLAYWAVRLLPRLIDPGAIPAYVKVEVGPPVLVFTLLVSLATGMLFGLTPALQLIRPRVAQTLRDNVRGSGGVGRHRLRSAFVVAEVALAMLLLVGSVLFIQSFRYLTRTDPGFVAENLLLFELALPVKEYEDDKRQTLFFSQLRERLRSLPGVSRVSHSMPLLGGLAVHGDRGGPSSAADRRHTFDRNPTGWPRLF